MKIVKYNVKLICVLWIVWILLPYQALCQSVPSAKAVKIQKKAESGDPFSQGLTAKMYDWGSDGLRRDYAKAVKFATLSADKKHPLGMYALAGFLSEGKGLHGDLNRANALYKECFPLMKQRAESGNSIAQHFLAFMYRGGLGVPLDLAKAVYWFRKSAEQGCALGQVGLASMYEYGTGVGKDEVKAVYLFRQAADQGDVCAIVNLGNMYSDGRGVARDGKRAVRLFRRAAAMNYPMGLNNLGNAYLKGNGVPQSDVEAAKWFRKSAMLGCSYGVGNLAWMYKKGRVKE